MNEFNVGDIVYFKKEKEKEVALLYQKSSIEINSKIPYVVTGTRKNYDSDQLIYIRLNKFEPISTRTTTIPYFNSDSFLSKKEVRKEKLKLIKLL